MSTLTISPSATAEAGHSYARNVGRAARALLAALLALPQSAPARSREAVRGTTGDDLDLYRLYRMTGSSDSLMPNLAQELRTMAARHE